MKILIVSYRFSPDASPRAFRWSTLANAWADQSHDVTVLTTSKPGLPGRSVEHGVQVLRTGPAWRASAGKPGANPLKTMARSLYRQFLRPHQWPDYAATWLRAAERLVESNFERPDLLITVSHPHSSHLVGLAVRRKFPEVRWIADIGDPFSFLTETPMNDFQRFGERNRESESEILAAADAVAVTCEPCRVEYARRFPEAASKLAVIGPMLPPIAFPPRRRGQDRGRVDWVFAGRFYPKIRPPDDLLRLFSAVRLQDASRTHTLQLYGDVNGFDDLVDRPPAGVVWNGMVSREMALQALSDADLLVHIGNTTPYQLPSKAVEYVMAERSILNISAREPDLSSDFFQPLPWALSVSASQPGFPDEAALRVAAFLDSGEAVPNARRSAEFLAPFRVDAVRRAYEELF